MLEIRYVGRAARIRIPGGLVLLRLVPTSVEDTLADWLSHRPEFLVARPDRSDAVPAAQPERRIRQTHSTTPDPAPDTTASDPIPTISETATDASAANDTPDAAEGDQRDA
jgi:hypothetical protein